ncbi:MAG: exodeoxyribonuclease VII large subunit [Terriglobales bacterium]
MQEQAFLPFGSERQVWTVTALAAQLKKSLERDFFDVWVEGEISNFHRSPAGHCYFTLKDAATQLRCALFAGPARLLKFRPQDGLQVLARGRISLYETRGDLQLYVERLEPRGAGGLQAAFEELKERLRLEGLFDPARKRPLPPLPRRIGIVTSPRGAAIADMVRILRRRYPNIGILLAPVQVQGAVAAAEIAAAIQYLGAPPAAHRVDVIIAGRGGGSLEDLWAFNEEIVARAIVACPIPVISAVGHETDFTIADFAADLRAPTPSAAAELAVRLKSDLAAAVLEHQRRLAQALRFRLTRKRRGLLELSRHRAFTGLRHAILRRAQAADELAFRLQQAIRRHQDTRFRRWQALAAAIRAQEAQHRLAAFRQALDRRQDHLTEGFRRQLLAKRRRGEALDRMLQERNPLAILQRGYALVYGPGRQLITRPAQLNPGDPLRLRLAAGWARATAAGQDSEPDTGQE